MKRIILILLVIGGLSFACDDEIKYNIPYAEANLKLDLNYEDIDLVPQLNYKIFTQPRAATDKLGYGGILVINGFGSNRDNINLFAYDLTCPVEIDRDIKVVPNNNGQAVCPKCGAVYDISSGYGNSVSGSKFSLRPYNVSALSGLKQYRVTN